MYETRPALSRNFLLLVRFGGKRFSAFNSADRTLITNAKVLQGRSIYEEAKAATTAGQELEFAVENYRMILSPGGLFSGVTWFEAATFHVEADAMVSKAEFYKTILHETYRLAFQTEAAAGAAGASTALTQAAASFAERAYLFL